MPTKKKRHICFRCDRKLTEDQMNRHSKWYNTYNSAWFCNDTAVCIRIAEHNKRVLEILTGHRRT
jgi:hypothetical protein